MRAALLRREVALPVGEGASAHHQPAHTAVSAPQNRSVEARLPRVHAAGPPTTPKAMATPRDPRTFIQPAAAQAARPMHARGAPFGIAAPAEPHHLTDHQFQGHGKQRDQMSMAAATRWQRARVRILPAPSCGPAAVDPVSCSYPPVSSIPQGHGQKPGSRYC